MLESKWNTHYGDTEDQATGGVYESYLPPAEKYPKEIENYGEAARLALTEGKLMSERPECEAAYLEELGSERYAYDSDAAQDTRQYIKN